MQACSRHKHVTNVKHVTGSWFFVMAASVPRTMLGPAQLQNAVPSLHMCTLRYVETHDSVYVAIWPADLA